MTQPVWRVDDVDPAAAAGVTPAPVLASLHFVRSALRRRWYVWAATGLLGLLFGAALPIIMPASSSGTATLLLSHPEGSDPSAAMDTDMSLLRTRAVAGQVVDRLDLQMSAEDFQETVTAESETPTVLVLTVAAPTDHDALVRTKAVTKQFLRFRTEQLREQLRAQVAGYRDRVVSLREQMAALTKQYAALTTGPATDHEQASGVLSRRAELGNEVNGIQQQIEDATLQTGAVIGASHVLDPAAVVPHSGLRRMVLDTASGLIGGLALGMGLIIFLALSSDRLWRREEVSVALNAPVRFSVGHLGRRRLPRLPRSPRTSSRKPLEILVRGLEVEVSRRRGRVNRLLLGAIDNATDARLLAAALAARLTARGSNVFLIDLTAQGGLVDSLRAALDPDSGGESADDMVHRPASVPTFARGPIGTTTRMESELPKGTERRERWGSADVVLTVAEIDPAIGVDHLGSWAHRMVLLVTAGRSSVERLRTAGELIHAADVDLRYVMMTGADRSDESLGLAGVTEEDQPDSHRLSRA